MRKSLALQIRVSPKEKVTLEKLANKAKLSISSFVLSRVIPNSGETFQKLVSAVEGSKSTSSGLADIHDFLSKVAVSEIENLPIPNLHHLTPSIANYVAALIEMAVHQRGGKCPTWLDEIDIPSKPYFGSELTSLRAYLLVHSHPCFKRRNLFYDSGLGTRV